MIEVTTIGTAFETRTAMTTTVTFEAEQLDSNNLDITISWYIGNVMSSVFASFGHVDQIILSNHDKEYVNNWSAKEEKWDEYSSVKYMVFIKNDIIQFCDESRDNKMLKTVERLISEHKSPQEIREAVVEMGYSSEFAKTTISGIAMSMLTGSIAKMMDNPTAMLDSKIVNMSGLNNRFNDVKN